jgi:fibronectin type 3 domain-containing protein
VIKLFRCSSVFLPGGVVQTFLYPLFFVLMTIQVSSAASVTLRWDPSSDTNVVGYAVYYGTASGDYIERLDAGSQTTVRITDLVEGITYYFAVTAYISTGLESLPSNEIAYTVPSVPPAQTTGPHIHQFNIVDGHATMAWTTVSGRLYRVRYKNSLNDVQWIDSSSDLLATGSVLQWADEIVTNSQRFYAVVLLP